MPALPFVPGPDTVRIGSFVVSKSFFDALMPLVGAVVGGLITYATTVALESRRQKRERLERLCAERREGVAQALSWIEPVTDALEAATLAEREPVPEGNRLRFRRAFPDLICKLCQMPLSPMLRVHLPRECQALIYEAKRDLDRLKRLCLAAEPSLDECLREGARLHRELTAIRACLEDEWQRALDPGEPRNKGKTRSHPGGGVVYTVPRHNSSLLADDDLRRDYGVPDRPGL